MNVPLTVLIHATTIASTLLVVTIAHALLATNWRTRRSARISTSVQPVPTTAMLIRRVPTPSVPLHAHVTVALREQAIIAQVQNILQ